MADAAHPARAVPTFLIVEDHDSVRAALRDGLNTLFPGDRVLEAGSREEALSLATVQNPMIVLMDLSLPGMSGIEATRRINSLRPSARIVVLSIHEELVYQVEARAAGADAFVLKREMESQLVPALNGGLTRNPAEAIGPPNLGAC